MRMRSRHNRFLTPRRSITLVVLALILLVVSANLYYTYIQNDRLNEQRKAEIEAQKAVGLTSVKAATKFVWDETYWVVEGTDRDNIPVFVWVNEQGTNVIKVNEAVPRAEIKATFKKAKPDADIVRIRPGKMGGVEVWEIFYSRNEPGKHYYYDFYGFRDGRYIQTFNLPTKIADNVSK
jgi:uncharacterized protein YpmB